MSPNLGSKYKVNPLEEDIDVNDLILKVAEIPDFSHMTFKEITAIVNAKKFKINQFNRIQENVGMNGTTLKFSSTYEPSYTIYLSEHSVKNSRHCFILGFIAVLAFNLSEEATNSISSSNILAIKIIGFGLMLPTLFLSILLTFWKKANAYLEIYSFLTFYIIGLGLILKKQLFQNKGPILPLVILLIPLFGFSRMRFCLCSICGWLIVISYAIFSFSLAPDRPIDIAYQTINYIISLLVGMISVYRDEILRRRNYALRLPFNGQKDDEAIKVFRLYKIRKKNLLIWWNRKFKNPKVEEIFYPIWYLIDSFPFEHPKSGDLHKEVFRTIRFAVYGIFINQIVLSFQDVRFLWVPRTSPASGLDSNDYIEAFIVALCLRGGVIVPAYISVALVMYYLGTHFYHQWCNQSIEINTETNHHVNIDIKEKKKTYLLSCLHSSGYVQKAQIYSTFVIILHGLVAATLLLQTTFVSESGRLIYLMGYLNSILFAHQSSFRLRFIYATFGTSFVVLIFLLTCYYIQYQNFNEYCAYSILVLILAMRNSFEQENLKRMFFVLRNIRMVEFEEWFNVIKKLQGWVKRKLRNKAKAAHKRFSISNIAPQDDSHVVTNLPKQLLLASQFGIYVQLFNLLVVLTLVFFR